jgi:hypothetical protein
MGPITIVSNSITGGTLLNITLTSADVGKYFTFDTTGSGAFAVAFNVDAFPDDGTFYIKNVTTTADDVEVQFTLATVTTTALINNPLIHKTNGRNSVLCVAYWDLVNLYIL